MAVVLTEPLVHPDRLGREQLHNIIIRPAQSEDVEFLGELWLIQRNYHMKWDKLYKNTPDARYNWINNVMNWLQEKNHCILVAENSFGHIIGYIHGSYHEWVYSPFEYYGSLNTISVAEDARGQGVGRSLVEELLEWFKEKEIMSVSIHVDCRNHVAMNLYKSVGFRDYQYRLMLELTEDVVESDLYASLS